MFVWLIRIIHTLHSEEDAPCLWGRHIHGHAGEGDVEEIDSYLSQTGFKGFAYKVYGSALMLFHAEKG